MDPRTGRFASVDPWPGHSFDPPTLHRYTYVRGDVINRVDPTGLFEGLSVQMIATGIRVGLAAMNVISFGTNIASGTRSAVESAQAFRNGDPEEGLGLAIDAVMRYGLAALSAYGIRSFISSPPTFTGGVLVATGPGGGVQLLNTLEISNPAMVGALGISLMGTPSEAKSKVARGQGPSGIHRIDRPNSSVPGSQWHAHNGPGEGSPAVNLDGTPKHGDNSWITNAIREFLKAHGWNL
jgi:hypothetical protein